MSWLWGSSASTTEPAKPAEDATSSAASSVTSFFSGIATKIQSVIEDEKEQFEREQQQTSAKGEKLHVEPSAAPWEVPGLSEEKINTLKERIIALGKTKRTFLDAPPADAKFTFDYKSEVAQVLGALKADPHLEKMRFWLVPQYIREPNFWRNYFYRVSLVKDAYLTQKPATPGAPQAPPSLASADLYPPPTSKAPLAALVQQPDDSAVRDPSADVLVTIEVDPEFVSEASVPDQLTIDDDKLEEEINAQLQKP